MGLQRRYMRRDHSRESTMRNVKVRVNKDTTSRPIPPHVHSQQCSLTLSLASCGFLIPATPVYTRAILVWQAPREWKAWFLSAKPEESPLPGDWENKCSDLQRLCVLRSLRPDRITFSASTYVSNNLGPQFADPPNFDLKVSGLATPASNRKTLP